LITSISYQSVISFGNLVRIFAQAQKKYSVCNLGNSRSYCKGFQMWKEHGLWERVGGGGAENETMSN
jgi:hypothetical protein